MSAVKTMASSAAALLLLVGPAAAVTVKNTSSKEVTIGIDYGSQAKVAKVPAGKSLSFDCNEGCGVTGPWSFSWMAKGNDTFTPNGKDLIDVG